MLKKLLYLILILFVIRFILSKLKENFKDLSDADFESIKNNLPEDFKKFSLPENNLLKVYQESQTKELPERLTYFKDNFKIINDKLIDDLYFDLRLYDTNKETLNNIIKAYFYMNNVHSMKKVMDIEIDEKDLPNLKNLLIDYVKHNEFTKKKDEY